MEERNETRETEETPSNELDGNLSQFVLAARTKQRKECKPSSLRGILSSHGRRLSRANYGQCIRLRATTALTDEETDILFDKQLLGVRSSPH